jgi:hypothetical protein
MSQTSQAAVAALISINFGHLLFTEISLFAPVRRWYSVPGSLNRSAKPPDPASHNQK